MLTTISSHFLHLSTSWCSFSNYVSTIGTILFTWLVVFTLHNSKVSLLQDLVLEAIPIRWDQPWQMQAESLLRWFQGTDLLATQDMSGNPEETISYKGFVLHSLPFIDSPILCSNEGKHVRLNYLSISPPGLEDRVCCGSHLLEMYIWWDYEKGPSQWWLFSYGT